MNLFLIGWCGSGQVVGEEARSTVASLARDLPFFQEGCTQSWRAPSGHLAVACVAHELAKTGDVAYAHFEADRFALFSGRPVVWTGEFEADGRSPLDPLFYFGDPETWTQTVDGRCVAARYDDASTALDLYTDPLGSYQVFVTERNGTSWLSNNAELLRRLTGIRRLSPLAVASLVACGWSFGGQPLWEGVRLLPPGAHRYRPHAPATHRELLDTGSIATRVGSGLDAQSAAKTLVATVRALADWPERPTYLSLTGGRDSRLVLAAAVRADIEFQPRIIVGSAEEPESPDVRTARLVSESVGRTLRVASSDPVATLDDAARLLRLTAPGMLQLDLAWAALNRPDQDWWHAQARAPSPLPLIIGGQAGEIARHWYDVGNPQTADDAASRLYRRATRSWPPSVLTREGRRLLKAYLGEWVSRHLESGVGLEQISEIFYLLERTANWVAPSHAFDEYMSDLTAPLWSGRMLAHELGLPAGDRARELFHYSVLDVLEPGLTRLSFSAANPDWPTFGRTRPAPAPEVRKAAGLVQRELSRRYRHLAHRRAPRLGERMLGDAAGHALERALGRSASDDIWRVLDRRRTLRLLRRDPRGLDVRSRRNAWRVATVFLIGVD